MPNRTPFPFTRLFQSHPQTRTVQRHQLWLLAVLACLSLAISTTAADRPNIVLIMADDMGYECVGANGGTSYETPVLDQMAKDAMRFTNAHSQPICTPSRVQIMTGIYNSRNYLRFGLLDPQAITFGNVMKKAGYATCIAGKWQLKGGFEGPNNFGFDEYCLWQLTRRPNRYPNPGLEINGKEVDFKQGQYGPDIVSDYLCDFIERHKDGPFFAYYPMMLPHWPFEPTPDSKDWDPKARIKDKSEKGSGNSKADLKYFADMVTYTDKIVGKVNAKLHELGIAENTLLIFTGDNGTYTGITSMMGDRKIQGGKGHTTDNGTHVPMFASWPGTIKPGTVNRDLIDFSDLLPTLADLAAAPLPKNARPDGRSFLPQLRGEKGNPREWVYCWYERNGNVTKATQHVRNARYKLYADGRFFDVIADPQQNAPLAANSLTDDQKQLMAKFQVVLDDMSKMAMKRQPPKPKQPKAKTATSKAKNTKANKNAARKSQSP